MLCTCGTLACRRNQIRSSFSALRLMSGSWHRLTLTLAACSPVPGRPARQPFLIRRLAGRPAAEQSAIILANLDQIAEDLAAGAVVVIGDDWIRIRRLPMPG